MENHKDGKDSNEADGKDSPGNNGTDTIINIHYNNSSCVKAFFLEHYHKLIAFGIPIVIPASILCGIVFAFPETFGDFSVFHVIGSILLIIGYSVLVSGCIVCVYERCYYKSAKNDKRAIKKNAFTKTKDLRQKKNRNSNHITPRRSSKRMSITSIVKLKPISENNHGAFAPDGEDIEVIEDLNCTIHVPTIIEEEIT